MPRTCLKGCTVQYGILKAQFASRTVLAELRPSNVAAHRGQASMPCVTHDFLVGHAVAVGGCDKPGAQTMWAHRFCQSALQPGLGSAFEKDLSNRISAKPAFSTTPPRLTLRNSGPAWISDDPATPLRL
jgi:hypothetical protein